jgi:hypothetical protein
MLRLKQSNLYYLAPGNSPKHQANSTGRVAGQTQPKRSQHPVQLKGKSRTSLKSKLRNFSYHMTVWLSLLWVCGLIHTLFCLVVKNYALVKR